MPPPWMPVEPLEPLMHTPCVVRESDQPDPAGQQLLHHALFELGGFGALLLQRGNLGIHFFQNT